MSCEQFHGALSEFVDGRIDRAARDATEQHLTRCPACRTLVADLRAIRQTASSLDRLAPPERVWPRIAAEIRTASTATGKTAAGAFRATAWRRAWRPFALAATIVLAVAIGALYTRPGRPAPEPDPLKPGAAPGPAAASASGGAELAQTVESELRIAEEHYDKAIAGLEQIARAEGQSLDPQVAAVLQKNLAIIDQAIGESRAALRSAPNSPQAQQSLFEALRNKVNLLQDTIALINEMRKGNPAEAARLVQGLNKS
jgi:hypothetical protein